MHYFSTNGLLRLIGAGLAGVGAAALALAMFAPARPARAADVVRYVADTGTDAGDCRLSGTPCLTPQYAIDNADPGDVVKIAAGTYTSVGTITFTQTSEYAFTQIAFISKTLTISGGYTSSNWATADASANPTIFDAEGYGRGITIFGSGTEVVTVTGLTLTNGDYTGLGNPTGEISRLCFGSDCGGGLYASSVELHASTLTVTGNTASRSRTFSWGGGINLRNTLPGSTLTAMTFSDNLAPTGTSNGGAMALDNVGALTITNGLFSDNHAVGSGGAISVLDPHGQITLIDTRFERNGSEGYGAVIYFESSVESQLRLEQSQIVSTTSKFGDVIALINFYLGDKVHFSNVLVGGTAVTETTPGRGLIHVDVQGSQTNGTVFSAAHITAADNEGVALLEIQAPAPVPSFFGTFTATLTNTLVTDLPALFLPVQGGSSTINITADHTLTESVPALTTGAVGTASITLNNTISGAALLGGDYRPQALSAAIDAGLNLGIALDASGAVRDSLPDIGALESSAPPPQKLFLPVLRK